MWVKDREEEEGGGLLSGKSKNNKKNMIKEIDKIQEVKDNLLQAWAERETIQNKATMHCLSFLFSLVLMMSRFILVQLLHFTLFLWVEKACDSFKFFDLMHFVSFFFFLCQ